MTRTLFAILATGIIGFGAPAVAATFAEVDSNGDGGLSQEEFAAAYPEATEDVWTAADANADGAISEEELQAAIESGALPAE